MQPPRDIPSWRSAVRKIWDGYQVVLLALAGALVIKLFVLGAVYVPSRSMEGTLHTGARLPARFAPAQSGLSSLHLPGLAPLSRGDVVVFELPVGAFPDTRAEHVTFVKRCIALAGDEVSIASGNVLVNGRRLAIDGSSGDSRAQFGPVRVPRKGDLLS